MPTTEGRCDGCKVLWMFESPEPLRRLGCPRCGVVLRRPAQNWTGQVTHGVPMVLPEKK